jgi:hypothetical protein
MILTDLKNLSLILKFRFFVQFSKEILLSLEGEREVRKFYHLMTLFCQICIILTSSKINLGTFWRSHFFDKLTLLDIITVRFVTFFISKVCKETKKY